MAKDMDEKDTQQQASPDDSGGDNGGKYKEYQAFAKKAKLPLATSDEYDSITSVMKYVMVKQAVAKQQQQQQGQQQPQAQPQQRPPMPAYGQPNMPQRR